MNSSVKILTLLLLASQAFVGLDAMDARKKNIASQAAQHLAARTREANRAAYATGASERRAADAQKRRAISKRGGVWSVSGDVLDTTTPIPAVGTVFAGAKKRIEKIKGIAEQIRVNPSLMPRLLGELEEACNADALTEKSRLAIHDYRNQVLAALGLPEDLFVNIPTEEAALVAGVIEDGGADAIISVDGYNAGVVSDDDGSGMHDDDIESGAWLDRDEDPLPAPQSFFARHKKAIVGGTLALVVVGGTAYLAYAHAESVVGKMIWHVIGKLQSLVGFGSSAPAALMATPAPTVIPTTTAIPTVSATTAPTFAPTPTMTPSLTPSATLAPVATTPVVPATLDTTLVKTAQEAIQNVTEKATEAMQALVDTAKHLKLQQSANTMRAPGLPCEDVYVGKLSCTILNLWRKAKNLGGF